MKIVVIGGTGLLGAHLSDSEPIPGTHAIRFATRFEDRLHA
jgi:nucleoside-diphosphate-sugar epimerase